MVWETGVQFQVKWLNKWYLIPPCLLLRIIRYGSRVKWSNPGNEVAPSSTPQCNSYWKGSFWVTLDYSRQSLYRAAGIMVRVFTNGPGDRDSIPSRVIPKTQKMVLDAALPNTQDYKVRVKWSNPEKGVASSPTPQCSSYWKRETFGHPRLRSPTLLFC